MSKRKITLLGNELIIREEIRIDELCKLFPEEIKRVTPTAYIKKDDIVITGLDNIILRTTYKEWNPICDSEMEYKDVDSSLSPYVCIRFVGQESSEGVWMRQMDKEGNVCFGGWLFCFDDKYTYNRPLDIMAIKNFPRLEFCKMNDAPFRHITHEPFTIIINDGPKYLYIVPII